MPYKRKYTGKVKKSFRKSTRRTVKKLEHRFKSKDAYRVKPEPFPRVLQTRAKYALVSSLVTDTFTTATALTFRLNSIYDPYYPTGGSTVVGHSALSTLYSRYLVTGVKVNVRFYDPSSDAVRVGIRLRINGENPTLGESMTSLIEQPMTYQSGLANSGSQIKTFNMFVRPWTLMGISKLEYMANTSKYSSLMTSNPPEDKCLMDIFAVEGTGVSRSVAYAVKLTYYVTFYDRKPLVSTS